MLTVNVEGTRVAVVPADPTRKAVVAMLNRGTNDIWVLGKDAQRRLGLDVVPPNYEVENAAGRYLRAVEAAPPELVAAIVDLRAALEARVIEVVNGERRCTICGHWMNFSRDDPHRNKSGGHAGSCILGRVTLEAHS